MVETCFFFGKIGGESKGSAYYEKAHLGLWLLDGGFLRE